MYLLNCRSLCMHYIRSLPSIHSSHYATKSPPIQEEWELKEAASIAVKMSHRKNYSFLRWIWNLKVYYRLIKYRLFTDHRFRVRKFKTATRNSLNYVAISVCAKKFDDLKDLFTPEALKKLRQDVVKDQDIYAACRGLLPDIGHIYKQIIFDANSVTTGNDQRFEITQLYVCKCHPSLEDRKKMTIILRPNRIGGVDEVVGTIPADAYVFIMVWLTLTKPIGKADMDWKISRFEPTSGFVSRKYVFK